jgi:hypothetical protein
MAIVNSLNQVGAVEVEEFLRGRTRLRFGPFLGEPEFILEPCCPFKSPESLHMFFIGNSGKGSSLAILFTR